MRELREELTVDIKALRYLTSIDTNDAQGVLRFHMFVSFQWDGSEPAPRDDEHTELRWFDLEDACRLQPLALEGYRESFRLAVGTPLVDTARH